MNDGLTTLLGLLVAAWYLSHQAGRLDRLHQRLDLTWDALQASMLARAELARDVAARIQGPASAEVVRCATAVLRLGSNAAPQDVASAQNALTRALGSLVQDADSLTHLERAGSRDRLAHACRRVALSRRFHADAVTACQLVRRQLLVRWLRLAGHAAPPFTLDFDDEVPGL